MKRALISVSDKSELLPFARTLVELGMEVISTGGTARTLTEAGLPVTQVSALTGYPELLDGRVKTLHPAIAAAILARGEGDQEELNHLGIQPIDLVVVNLYPFEEAARHEDDLRELVEWIDIGGVTLLRAAAKNWERVGVVCEPGQYGPVEEELRRRGGLSPETRRRLAARAIARTAAYDAAIAARLADGDPFPETLLLAFHRREILHYGENPHQRGALYVEASPPPGEVTTAVLLQGKPLSYNNLLDLTAAWDAVREFSEPAAVMVKHGIPCGVALGRDAAEAVARAIASDPISAFGGILAVNRPFDEDTAGALTKGFRLDVLIAPEVTAGARTRLASRKALRVLEAGSSGGGTDSGRHPSFTFRSLPGGLALQDPDTLGAPLETTVVTHRGPDDGEWRDLHFAWLVCKHVRSNAIVLAKDNQTVGIGAGQMSRVDSVRIAVMKAGAKAAGAVLASDGLFPFPDGVEAAAEAGVAAVIQPGGSVRDAEVIAAADLRGVAMVFTGERHFRH